ncbi:MAG: FtsX-like permease family protein [Candidatus Nanohaloarchaea archaeon]|nr:FtsX-like permease family protein [Candidatus Nanohaloarchaea archaeon]
MNSQKYKFTWLLAKRDILEDKRISLIVIAMLSFSFLNLTFFPAFINGLSNTFTSNIIQTQTGHVLIEAEEGRLKNADAIVKQVKSLNNVKNVEKRLSFSAKLEHRSNAVTAQVFGTDNMFEPVYGPELISGNLIGQTDTGKILLGKALAEESDEVSSAEGLEVNRGRVISLKTDNTTRDMKVEGVLGKPGPSPLSRQSFISYEEAEDILDAKDEASSIKVLVEDSITPEEFKKRLQRLNTRGEIRTWKEVSDFGGNLQQTFAIVTLVVSVVGIIIAVTSVGVVIFINSSKRKREMGIIRAIGSESGQVLQIFLLEALIFGVLGTLVGGGIMIGVDRYLAVNPIQAPIGVISTELTTELLFTRSVWMVVSALVAGFLPAYLVSKQSIIDAIESR